MLSSRTGSRLLPEEKGRDGPAQSRRWFPAAWLSVILVLAMLTPGCLVPMSTSGQNIVPAYAPRAESISTLPSVSGVVNRIMPSVVYIFVTTNETNRGEPVFAAGSGIIMSTEGYILTNRHVVEGAISMEVTLQNRKPYEVTETYTDDILDLAVVKIAADNITAAVWGNPDQIMVGDWVLAVGHPLGLSPTEGGATVTSGVVSNLGRSFFLEDAPYFDVIQTDAAINPGNSGGPLVNLAGEVIGINSVGTGDGIQGIGFAINVATARHAFEDLVKYGKSHHPYFGATLEDITPASACTLCLAQRIGTVITSVDPGSPADTVGLQANDIIVHFGDAEITSTADLIRALWRHEVGDRVDVVYWRGTEQKQTQVILGQRPQSGGLPTSISPSDADTGKMYF